MRKILAIRHCASTIIHVEIAFDPAKDASNIRKHGISLAAAAHLDWDSLVEFLDERFEYGENRFIGYGPIDGRLYCVVYTETDAGVRVISLRKANKREVARYE
jgi:uncharacterized protein